MNCASCGKVNPADARYCVHCGAEQSVPTPIAAVAAAAMTARSGNAVLQAANAAQADPAADLRPRSMPQRERAPRPGGAVVDQHAPRGLEAGAIAGGVQAPPAYASAPRRTGLAAALIVACLLVAVIVFAGWRMLGGESQSGTEAAKESGDESVMSAFPPEATPQKERRSAAGTAPAQAPAGPDSTRIAAREAASGDAASRAVGSSGTLSGIAQDATPLAPAVPPVEIKPLPAKPAPKAARRPPVEKTPPSKPAPAPVASAATPAASEPAPVVAAAPKPAPVIDRWTRMSDELSRCTREDFIARVICDQRVRLRYCDGYWGKVTQCPGNPAPERGQ